MADPELLAPPNTGQLVSAPVGEPWLGMTDNLATVAGQPDQGDLCFETSSDKWYFYNHASTWAALGGGGGAVSPLTLTANTATETPLTLVPAAGQTAPLVKTTGTSLTLATSDSSLTLTDQTLTISNSPTGQPNVIVYLASDWGSPYQGQIYYDRRNLDETGGGAGQISFMNFRQFVVTDTGNCLTQGRLAVGKANATYGSGAGPMLFLANDTTDPSTNPVGGGILYCSNGALKYRGTSGTVTTLGPA